MMIEDGTGTGNKAEVNSQNQLRTRAINSIYHQFISCEHGQAYTASLGTELNPVLTIPAPPGGGGYMMYLKNTSTDWLLVLARITLSTSALMEVTVMKNPDIGALANSRTITPINKNFASGKVADLECKGWDEVGNCITGITGGDCAGTYQVNGFERILLDESLCLGINDIIAIKAKNAGDIAMVLHGYYIIPDCL